MFRANAAGLAARHPALVSPGALSDFDARLPVDLFQLEREAPALLRDMPDSALPTLISITCPCTAGSAAGRGQGAADSVGRVFLSAVTITGLVLEEYHRRGLAQPGFAGCGWVFETSPLRDGDTRPVVRELDTIHIYTMGLRAVDDAARRGSAAHRFTLMYSNMGTEEAWASFPGRGWVAPHTPLATILRPGELVQRFSPRKRGPASRPRRQKLDSVRRQLAAVYSPEEAERLLAGPEPHPVCLPNLRGTEESSTWEGKERSHSDFVTESIGKAARTKALREWWWRRRQAAPPFAASCPWAWMFASSPGSCA